MVVLAFGEQGNIVGSADGTFTARLTPEEYARAMRSGFLYTMDVELEKPGGYQVRAAVRDTASEKVGSAGQFLEGPDIRKPRLVLSGILLDEARPKPSVGTRPVPRKITALPVPAPPPFGCSAWARRSPTATRSTTPRSRGGSPRSKRPWWFLARQRVG